MNKTKYLVGAFVATALLMGGCGDEETTEVPTNAQTTQKLAGQRLTDDNGVEYTLIDNGDGTETARYDDGRSVTFRRQDDGSLDFLSGTAGLIAGMAAGYFLFHGFSRPAGNWDASRNRYTVSEPLKPSTTPANASNTAKPATNSTATNSTAKPAATTAVTPNTTAANSNSKVNLSKDNAPKTSAATSSNSSAKSGFGTAGARGGSSSAAS